MYQNLRIRFKLVSIGVRLVVNSTFEELANFSMFSSGNEYPLVWCQTSANDSGPVGIWYLPNGTIAQDSPAITILYEEGQIGIRLNKAFDTPNQGLYTCVIPDENNVNQSLVVGIFPQNFYGLAGNMNKCAYMYIIVLLYTHCSCSLCK